MAQKRRVLIVVFDALRPDMVSAELMPELTAFAAAGARFSASRAVFPSETRVNQSALITGCRPGRHGIVGNKFIEPTASPDKLLNTGDEHQLRAAARRLNGALLAVPSLGELLAERGLRLATLSAGTPGGGRILNHRGETCGGFRFAMHCPDAACPTGVAAALNERVGAIPPHAIPSLDWLSWAGDAWLNFIEPELRPDVGILWFCEPDNSYHYCGIGSPDNLAALRHADTQFGRIKAAFADRPEVQIITLSDHGQIAVSGEALGLAERLRGAGFSVGAVPGPRAELALALDSAGGVFVRDRDPELTARAADWFLGQPWCGALSLADNRAGLPGVVGHKLLGIAGPRAPDIGLVLRATDAPGPWAWPGSTVHDAPYPSGGGTHGGLHPRELHNWLALGGTAVVPGAYSTPAGIIDVLPTVLWLLDRDVDLPQHLEGRVLHEALAATGRRPPPAHRRLTVAVPGGSLSVCQVGTVGYLDGITPPSAGALT